MSNISKKTIAVITIAIGLLMPLCAINLVISLIFSISLMTALNSYALPFIGAIMLGIIIAGFITYCVYYLYLIVMTLIGVLYQMVKAAIGYLFAKNYLMSLGDIQLSAANIYEDNEEGAHILAFVMFLIVFVAFCAWAGTVYLGIVLFAIIVLSLIAMVSSG
tara:strand:- start:1823 stop:2308 length:486 start_codon:yes stop_codon:yes gene_type:complete